MTLNIKVQEISEQFLQLALRKVKFQSEVLLGGKKKSRLKPRERVYAVPKQRHGSCSCRVQTFVKMTEQLPLTSGLLSFYYTCFLTASVANTLSAHGRKFRSQGHSLKRFVPITFSESYTRLSNVTNQTFKNPFETEEAVGSRWRVTFDFQFNKYQDIKHTEQT